MFIHYAQAQFSAPLSSYQTLYATYVTASNGMSVCSVHSRLRHNPTIAGFMSPRTTSPVAQQNSSAFSAPR